MWPKTFFFFLFKNMFPYLLHNEHAVSRYCAGPLRQLICCHLNLKTAEFVPQLLFLNVNMTSLLSCTYFSLSTQHKSDVHWERQPGCIFTVMFTDGTIQYCSEVEMVVTGVISSFLCFENKEPKHQALSLPNRNAHTAVLYSSSQKSISVSLTSSNDVLWVIHAVM